MPLVVKDRVKEITATTGTGTLTLGGAPSGFQSFSVIGNGNTTYYAIVDQAAGAWEVGVGTYTASGTTLSRDSVLESSNSGSLVNFGAGSKDVFCTYPAERSLYVDGSSIVPATSATLPITSGGTGASSQQAALNAVAGAVTSGQYLRGNGTNVSMSAIQAGDVPTLNQNTTGSAGSVANAVTFNNSGSGDVSGTSFNGSAARTVSYNTVGAPSTSGTNATGTWGINISGNAATATTATNQSGGTVAATTGSFSSNLSVGTGVAVDPSNVSGFAAGQITEGATGFSAPGIVIGSGSGSHGAIVYGAGTMFFGAEAGTDNTMNTRATLSNAGAFNTTGAITQNGSQVLTAGNYNSYAPTLTGGGASGTWSINITGTAGNVSGTVAIGNGGTGATTAPNARTNLGATTVGSNLFTLTNPSAVRYLQVNADNTVSSLDAASFRTAIGAGTGNGTVTSVGISAGTGISVSGSPITSSGSMTVTNSAPMVYPGAGIPVSTGSAWTTSKTNPSGAFVGTTDTQTLTNKTITNLIFDGNYTEEVFTIVDGTVDLNPANGTIQLWTLGASRSPTASSFASGQSMLLMVNDGTAFTITWPSVVWVGGSAPTLATTGFTVIALWKVSTTLYGALVGAVA